MKKAYSLRFSRSAETYERWAVPQRESALILVEFVKPRGRVLDLGCGTGFVSKFLREDCSPIGLDIAPNMVRVFKRSFPFAVVGDAEALPFKEESFDFVLSNFSLHWTNLSKSLPEALRVSKVGAGIALPVKGSLEGIDFPFPSEEEVLEKVKGMEKVHFVREIAIPFRGWDLVRFFHYTGSSLNPKRKRTLSRGQIEKLISSIESPSFRMLFLYVRRV